MIIGRMKLLELARKASKAIRPSITPIKESLKIEAVDGKLQITGMSTEMVICAYDEIEDNTSFTCVVTAKIFTDILNKMVSDTVELSLVKSDSDEIDILVIKGGISSLNIQTFDAASWSDLPKFTPKIKLKVNPKYFQDCAHALSKSDDRGPIIECYHIEEMESGYKIVALDGFRISERISSPKGVVVNDFIINGEFIKTALSIAGDDITIETDDEKIRVSKPGISIYGQMTNGSYFNIKAFEAISSSTSLTLVREDLLDAIRVSAIMDDSLVFDTDCKTLKIGSRRDIGKSNSELPILSASGETRSAHFALKANYIADALNSITDEYVTIELPEDLRAVFMKGEDYLEFILPRLIKK